MGNCGNLQGDAGREQRVCGGTIKERSQVGVVHSEALKVSEDVVEIHDFAVAECPRDGGSIGGAIESLALEEEILVLAGRSHHDQKLLEG